MTWSKIKSFFRLLASEEGAFVASYLLMNSIVVFWVVLALAIFVDAVFLGSRYAQ